MPSGRAHLLVTVRRALWWNRSPNRAVGDSLLAVAILHASFDSSAEMADEDIDWARYVATLALGVVAAPGSSDRRR